MKTPHTVIIGAGLAGLLCALRLARAGHRVDLYERRSQPGGRARSRDQDGFRLNLGPHALYRKGALARELGDLGLPFSGPLNPVDPVLWAGGRGHVLPGGPWTMLTTTALSTGGRWALARVLGQTLALDPTRLDRVSVATWTQDMPADARAVMLAVVRIATYVNAPDLLSAGTAARQIRRAMAGVHYVDGGWQRIVDGLLSAVSQAGVALHLGVEAPPLQVVDGHVVLAAGPEAADAVVLAVPPRVAAELCPAAAVDLTPVKAAVLDLGFDTLPVPERPGALGVDVPAYAIRHSDPQGMAKAGVLFTAAWYRAPGCDDPRADLEAFVDAVQPGWREQARMVRYLPELTVTHALPLAQQGGEAGRPSAAVPGVAGLWRIGDHIGPEGMLADAAAASARSAADAIVAMAPAGHPSVTRSSAA